MQRPGSTGVSPVGPLGILPGGSLFGAFRLVAPGETPGGPTGKMPVLRIS